MTNLRKKGKRETARVDDEDVHCEKQLECRDAPPVGERNYLCALRLHQVGSRPLSQKRGQNGGHPPAEHHHAPDVVRAPVRIVHHKEPQQGLHGLLEQDRADDLRLGDKVARLDLVGLMDAVLVEAGPAARVEKVEE